MTNLSGETALVSRAGTGIGRATAREAEAVMAEITRRTAEPWPRKAQRKRMDQP